jgi:ferric-dicitrate binding protein FerR (iron transport regulator)
MLFQQEFLGALQSGKDHRALLEIVRRHYAGKETGREAYESLERLWRDLGFQD